MTLSANDRFTRQRVLREIGDRGQERLEAGTYSPNPALGPAARKIALRYASGAGFGNIGPDVAAPPPPVLQFFRHGAAADVGLAAADVLSQSLPHFDLQA